MKTPCLEILEARGCSFNDPAMTMIGRSLRLGSHVRILHLENCFLSGRPLMLLGTMFVVFIHLFLTDNVMIIHKNIVQFCEFLPHLFKLLAVVISEFYFWHSLCYVQKEWRVTDIAYLVHRFTMAVTSLINASRGNIQCHMTSFFILLYHFMVPLFLLLMV